MDKENLLKLITLYRDREALWNMHSPKYKWTEVKREAIAEIAKEMEMTEEEVKKRIKSVRGTYVQEKTKVDKGKKVGRNAKGVYVSTLWWYNEMSFLDKCIIPRTADNVPAEKTTTNGRKPDMFDRFCDKINRQLRTINKKHAYDIIDKIEKLFEEAAKGNKLASEENSEAEMETNDLSDNNDSSDPQQDETIYLNNTEDSNDVKSSEFIESIDIYSEVETTELQEETSKQDLASKLRLEREEEFVEKLQPKSIRFTTKERKFVCPICGYAGTERSNMIAHIQRHTKNKQYKCDECEKAFHTRTELNTHIRSHTGERPYLCTICGKAFSQSSQLGKHIKRHNKNPDKECHVCKKKFYETKNLREHMNTHSENREHVCTFPQCNASFKQKMCLQDHMKLHENKREYQCKLCDSKFNQRAGLYSHMKTNHTVVSTSVSVLI